MSKRNPKHLKLILWADILSQPGRAVVSFCQENGIEFEHKETGIFEGKMNPKEYGKISPLRKIPAM